LPDLRRRKFGDCFAIDSHYLLMAGDNPRLNYRRSLLVLDRIRDVDLTFAQQFAELLPIPVFADQSDDGNFTQKFAEIAGDIGGAAWEETFACDFDHRDRRLRRYACDLAPDELIQHQVADHQDALGRRAVENLP